MSDTRSIDELTLALSEMRHCLAAIPYNGWTSNTERTRVAKAIADLCETIAAKAKQP
jgi:hypothetical protein